MYCMNASFGRNVLFEKCNNDKVFREKIHEILDWGQKTNDKDKLTYNYFAIWGAIM